MSPSLHLHPINVVVYNDPEKSNLVAGFVLRCFQHLSNPPGAGEGPKGWAVRPLKWHASWVQNVVRQFGLYLSWAYEICVALTLVREDRVGLTSGLPVVPPGALPGI